MKLRGVFLDSKKIKILIIDDEEDIRYTISEICKFCGYDVLLAKEGEEGVFICKKENPDMVIVDYHMSGWDGMKTVKELQKLKLNMAILVLTVDERQEIADKFMENGASDFAIKPIKAPDLIARIKVNLKIKEIERKQKKENDKIFIEKGISAGTLGVISEFFEKTDRELSIEEVSKATGLAYQTIHRYIQYMLEADKIELVPPIFGQLGRPKNKYKLVK